MFIDQLRQILRYREAVRNFVARDLKVRYNHSILGFVWSIFNPLLMMLVFWVVFTFTPFGNGMPRFPIFLLAGLLPWNFFSGSVMGTTSIIIGNGALIGRVYFPREILPLATILSNAVHFLLALLVLLGITLAYGTFPTFSLVWLPVLILIQILLSLGLGFFLAAVNVYLRDLQQVVEVGIQAWFFLTPILYTLDPIKQPLLWRVMMVANPMAALIANYRHLLYSRTPPDLSVLGLTTLQALLLLLIGLVIFRRLSPRFAEEI